MGLLDRLSEPERIRKLVLGNEGAFGVSLEKLERLTGIDRRRIGSLVKQLDDVEIYTGQGNKRKARSK